MRILAVLIAVAMLSACATPKPIADTAARVSTFSTDMNRSLADYAKSLARVREADARRIQVREADTDLWRRGIDEQIQIMKLAGDTTSLKVLDGLSAIEPRAALRPRSKAATAPPTFDSTPLKNVAKITADLARPRSIGEELRALFEFAKVVNADLAKATADNDASAKP